MKTTKIHVIAYCILSAAVTLMMKSLVGSTQNPCFVTTREAKIEAIAVSQRPSFNSTSNNSLQVLSNPIIIRNDDVVPGLRSSDGNNSTTRLLPTTTLFELYFVAVPSIERSSSTGFLYSVLSPSTPCFVGLNEIYNRGPGQAGDAWQVEGSRIKYDQTKSNGRGIHKLSDIVKFPQDVGQRRCQQKRKWLKVQQGLDMDQLCHGKCIVAFKEFSHHLYPSQHAYLWNHLPNLTVAILERNVNDRWKSMWLAAHEGDWDTSGSAKHKAKLNEYVNAEKIPPTTQSDIVCHTPAFKKALMERSGVCHFEKSHREWYDFIRYENPEGINVTFEDVVQNNGFEAVRKVRTSLQRKYRDFDTIPWSDDPTKPTNFKRAQST